VPLNCFLVEITVSHAVWGTRYHLESAVYGGWDAIPEGMASFDAGAAWRTTGSVSDLHAIAARQNPLISDFISPHFHP